MLIIKIIRYCCSRSWRNFTCAVVNNSNGFKSVNYNCLVGLMVEALKEQNERYEFLEKQFKDYNENNK